MVNFVFDSLAAHREHVAISLAGRELIYWYLKINENLEIQKNIIAQVSMLASLTESNQKIMQIQESYFQKFFAARSATSKKKVVPPQNPDDKWAPSQQKKNHDKFFSQISDQHSHVPNTKSTYSPVIFSTIDTFKKEYRKFVGNNR